MRAIVLAGEVGPHLRPITDAKPPALVQVNGRPILGYTLSALREASIEHITLCTGYRAAAIADFCAAHGARARIELIENAEFATTGMAYGLYLARGRLRDDCLFLNGTVVFDPEVLRRMLGTDGSAFAVDVGRHRTGAVKVVVEGGRIRRFARGLAAAGSLGSAIGAGKIAAADGMAIAGELERVVEGEGRRGEGLEDVLDRLCREGRVKAVPCDIASSRWYEIDTTDDLLEAELLFNDDIEALAERRVVLLDRDGTLALGGEPLPGARRFVEALRRRGARLFVMTNNSSKTRREHGASLARCGVPFGDDEILLSTEVAAQYLAKSGLRRVDWVATDEVGEYLRAEHGLEFDGEDPSAVLLTYDTTLDYAKLARATRHLQRGVRYFATHPDLTCPAVGGPLPDVGAFIELLRLTTGRTPEMVFGKPHRAMVDAGLARVGGEYRDVAVIGDRLDTDIALAEGTDMLSVLVLSGDTTRAQYESQERRANIVVRDLERLSQALERRRYNSE
jgi:HAD superfamily hydrolase (TIGR01450 family)